jgi:hypothetical protein
MSVEVEDILLWDIYSLNAFSGIWGAEIRTKYLAAADTHDRKLGCGRENARYRTTNHFLIKVCQGKYMTNIKVSWFTSLTIFLDFMFTDTVNITDMFTTCRKMKYITTTRSASVVSMLF